MPNCYYYDVQRNRCNCYVNENLNELLEENVNLRVQLANAMVTVRRVDERCAKLRELVRNLYKRFHGVVLENWSYSTEDFDMLACRMRELGIEVDE